VPRALTAGEPQRAAEAFRQAIRGDPKNSRLYLGAGVAAWLERRDEEAKTALERALALEPALDQARQLLGRVYYRLGDLQSAIAAYEALVASQPAEDAAVTLGRWRLKLELQTRMRQAVGNHFTVSFEGPEEADVAAHALESLDKAYWRIGELLATYPAAPVAVVLYTNQQFRDITRSPSWAAAAYDGTIRVPMRGALAKSEELDRVLSHEFAHALIRTLTARPIPTWLNEGLATALETDDLSWARSRVNGKTPASLMTLAGSFGHLSGAEAELAYASSALGVKRLLDEAGGFAVANLLKDLGDGVDFDRAFARRMPWTFADFTASASR
jgi:tetratricopeptide (TPR) repeat protein